METFTNKVDFAVIIMVNNANPNGDPLNGNRPRETYDGYGEISDVCIKRKIRNRLQDMGEKIFVQSEERADDGWESLSDRAKNNEKLKKALKEKDREQYRQAACEEWIDVRAFGQVFGFNDQKGMSEGIRGPVSIQSAFSVCPVMIDSMQITKSVNGAGKGKASDTMGMKHRVDFGVYILKGSINVQLSEKTGFTEEDAEKIKEAIRTLFVNDSSSARPDGSMVMHRLYWWKHNCKIGQYSSHKVHNSIEIKKKEGVRNPRKIEDYEIICHELPGLAVEEYEGL
mgnify:CR=1 FL=1